MYFFHVKDNFTQRGQQTKKVWIDNEVELLLQVIYLASSSSLHRINN